MRFNKFLKDKIQKGLMQFISFSKFFSKSSTYFWHFTSPKFSWNHFSWKKIKNIQLQLLIPS